MSVAVPISTRQIQERAFRKALLIGMRNGDTGEPYLPIAPIGTAFDVEHADHLIRWELDPGDPKELVIGATPWTRAEIINTGDGAGKLTYNSEHQGMLAGTASRGSSFDHSWASRETYMLAFHLKFSLPVYADGKEAETRDRMRALMGIAANVSRFTYHSADTLVELVFDKRDLIPDSPITVQDSWAQGIVQARYRAANLDSQITVLNYP